MAVISTAVVGIGVGLYSANKQTKALKNAAGQLSTELELPELLTPGGGLVSQGPAPFNSDLPVSFEQLAGIPQTQQQQFGFQDTQVPNGPAPAGAGSVLGSAFVASQEQGGGLQIEPVPGQAGIVRVTDPSTGQVYQLPESQISSPEFQAQLAQSGSSFTSPTPEAPTAPTRDQFKTTGTSRKGGGLYGFGGTSGGTFGRIASRARDDKAFETALAEFDKENPEPNQNVLQTTLGDREPARQGLVQLANQQIGRAGLGGGLPPEIQAALQNANQASAGFNDTAQSGLNTLSGAAGNVLGGTFGQFNNRLNTGFNQGLQNQAFAAAGNQLGLANTTGQQAREQALTNFRAQALPGQQRAVQGQLSSLFGSGRLGTTGGANQLGRLAEAQNQQDLGFQQAAFGEGRAAQTQSANLATNFSNLGAQQAGLGESLLQGAFSRFGNTAQIAGDINNQRFQRGLATEGLERQGAQQQFANQVQGASLGRQLQQQDLSLGTQALQAEGALQQQGLNNLGAALSVGSAEANARIGAGSNIAALAQNTNFGASPIAGLGEALVSNATQIGGLFNQPKDLTSGNNAVSIASDGRKYYGAEI